MFKLPIFKLFLLQVLLFLGQGTLSVLRAQENFKVGLILPLSGSAADYGSAIRNSIELARADQPNNFSKIKFQYEDAGYDVKVAISAFNKLVDFDKVNLVITWGVTFCKALAPIAELRQVPLVSLCVDSQSAANKKFVIRFMNVSDEFVQKEVIYLSGMGVKKIGLLVSDNSYLDELKNALERNLITGQTVSLIDRLPMGEMDFRGQILKIKKSDYDAVGVFLFLGQASTFYKQARQLNLITPTFGTNLFETQSEIRASDGTMEGGIFSNIEVNPEYIKRYREIFGIESQLTFGAPAYELAIAIGELFNDSKTGSRSIEVIESFSKITIKQGTAAGPYRYVNDARVGQYFKFPIVMKEVTKDSFRVLK